MAFIIQFSLFALALVSASVPAVSILGISNPVQLWPCDVGTPSTKSWSSFPISPEFGPISLKGPLYLTVNTAYAGRAGLIQALPQLDGNYTLFSYDNQSRLTTNNKDTGLNCLSPQYDLLFPGEIT